MKRHHLIVPADGWTIVPVLHNRLIIGLRVTGADRIELHNSLGRLEYVSTSPPHEFPIVLLEYPPDGYWFNDLIFHTTPSSVLEIEWDEAYIPYILGAHSPSIIQHTKKI